MSLVLLDANFSWLRNKVLLVLGRRWDVRGAPHSGLPEFGARGAWDLGPFLPLDEIPLSSAVTWVWLWVWSCSSAVVKRGRLPLGRPVACVTMLSALSGLAQPPF